MIRNIVFILACLVTLNVQAVKRPNIVLLFADDMGYGDLGCYGHPTIRTPNLDRLAGQGLRLTSFYSAPGCVPARKQLLLGRYPGRVHTNGNTGVTGKGGLSDSELTLAEALKGAGYGTAMLGKWHLGYAEEKFLPVNQGFDSWFGLPYSNDMMPPWVKTEVPLWLYEGTKRVEHPVNQDTLTTRYTERAVKFLERDHDKPFFLYLAYNMPHMPVRTADRFRGRSRAGLYGDVIQTIDWSVGEVMKTLDKTGRAKDTLVIFTSDNGPWLNPPARMLQEGNLLWHAGSPGPLSGHKGTLLEGGVRVPCILRWPGRIEAGQTSAEMAATLDLYATLVTAAGGSLPKHKIDGHDLRPFLFGKTKWSPRKIHFYSKGRGPGAVREGPWKLHADGRLFNLDIDPAERFDRAEEKPEIATSLKAKLEAMKKEISGK
ncbi:MAG: arylsulfatase [Verrucomicrobia bacterium]|nr:MAG: arylsulfatase [Verrucomicrobiota bacterium]